MQRKCLLYQDLSIHSCFIAVPQIHFKLSYIKLRIVESLPETSLTRSNDGAENKMAASILM